MKTGLLNYNMMFLSHVSVCSECIRGRRWAQWNERMNANRPIDGKKKKSLIRTRYALRRDTQPKQIIAFWLDGEWLLCVNQMTNPTIMVACTCCVGNGDGSDGAEHRQNQIHSMRA